MQWKTEGEGIPTSGGRYLQELVRMDPVEVGGNGMDHMEEEMESSKHADPIGDDDSGLGRVELYKTKMEMDAIPVENDGDQERDASSSCGDKNMDSAQENGKDLNSEVIPTGRRRAGNKEGDGQQDEKWRDSTGGIKH